MRLSPTRLRSRLDHPARSIDDHPGRDDHHPRGTTQATTASSLTDTAAAKVKALLEQEGRDDLALRVAVQPGGCSGLRYQLFFDERQLDGDVVKDFNGVNVVVDRMSVPYLGGATIDFVDTIEKQGFTIDNPNADRLLRLRRLLQLSLPRPARRRRRPPWVGAFGVVREVASSGGGEDRDRLSRPRRRRCGQPGPVGASRAGTGERPAHPVSKGTGAAGRCRSGRRCVGGLLGGGLGRLQLASSGHVEEQASAARSRSPWRRARAARPAWPAERS